MRIYLDHNATTPLLPEVVEGDQGQRLSVALERGGRHQIERVPGPALVRLMESGLAPDHGAGVDPRAEHDDAPTTAMAVAPLSGASQR